MNNTSIPVVMYHSIGIPNLDWNWNYLTCPYEVFENQLMWLKKRGFCTISLQQLYMYMKEGVELPKRSVVLTFDDGFLDNWIFAYPLLKKYGFKGTVYVNPEFADPRDITRKNLSDVWEGRLKLNELETVGYLSWNEMRKMENEGVMDIQSHSMTHTWYPISNKIINFRHPGDSYTWITWNNYPAKKPYLQLDDKQLIKYGEPVYESGRSLGIKRFFPDENLKEHLIDYVTKKGGINFFNLKSWRTELFSVVKEYSLKYTLDGKYENDAEYQQRLFYELNESKNIIETKLNKKVNFLCWPGGAVTDVALQVASNEGYLSSTAAKDLRNKRKYLKNKYGESPCRINRIGVTFYWDGVEGFGSKIKYQNGFYFVNSLYRFQGKTIISSISSLVLFTATTLYKMRNSF